MRPARPGDAAPLSALAIRSKAHWDYTEEQLAVFREELTLTEEDLRSRPAFVLEEAERALAFYTLAPAEEGVELEHLFVDPERLRGGLGRRLWEHALAQARAAGHRQLWIQSDPNAEGFYRSLGAEKTRDLPTSIPGRTLPLMRIIL